MKKMMNPALEKREENVKKDLDGDGERGEPKAHQQKVLGKKAAPPFAKKGTPPSAPMAKGKSAVKICPVCRRPMPTPHKH